MGAIRIMKAEYSTLFAETLMIVAEFLTRHFMKIRSKARALTYK